jgi:hypothetical protein
MKALVGGTRDFKTACSLGDHFRLLQHSAHPSARAPRAPADRVEEAVIVDQVFVAYYGDVHTGDIKLACVSQALLAKNIVTG